MQLHEFPPIILRMIADACDSFQQLALLARTSHKLRDIFTPYLYERNKSEPPIQSCVWWAVEHGCLATLRNAHAAGIDVNMTDAEYQAPSRFFHSPLAHPAHASPLHIAVKNGFLQIVRYLLDEGAAVNGTSRGLCGCFLRDMLKMIRLDMMVHDLHYPLHYAISHKEKRNGDDIVSLLMERGAYFAEPEIPGLRWAIKMGPRSTIDVLLGQKTFNPLATDKWGLTALHYVAHCQDPKLACYLVSKLVELNVPRHVISSEGTALQRMIVAGNHKPAIELVQKDDTIPFNIRPHYGPPQYAWWINCPPLWLVLHDYIRAYGMKGRIATPYPKLGDDRRRLIQDLISKGAGIDRHTWHDPASAPSLLPTPLTLALYPTHDARFMKALLDKGAAIGDTTDELSYVGNRFRYYDSYFEYLAEVDENIYPYPDIEPDRNMFPGPEGLIYWFFERFCHREPETVWQREFTRGAFEPFKVCLQLLLEEGAPIGPIGLPRGSALGLTCTLAASSLFEGAFALKFLVKHATYQNVTVEHVLCLMEEWRDYGNVHKLLRQLCDKIASTSRRHRF